MTSYLIDINVWIALTWQRHPQAGVAELWLNSLPDTTTRLLFCRFSQLGYLRLLANQAAMGDSVLTVGEALEAYDRWLTDPRVEFCAEGFEVDAAFRRALAHYAAKPATKAVMDAYLLGVADAERATLVTFDKALKTAASARKVACVLLKPN
jgi:toxin-antitoxin system PIN domain toxin